MPWRPSLMAFANFRRMTSIPDGVRTNVTTLGNETQCLERSACSRLNESASNCRCALCVYLQCMCGAHSYALAAPQLFALLPGFVRCRHDCSARLSVSQWPQGLPR